MKKISTPLLLLLLLPLSSLYSQKEWNNWVFGNKAAITFNTMDGEPRKYNLSPMMQLEGSASISSPDGYMALFTDGRKLWNINYERANTDDQLLDGNISSTQAAFIIPQPENPSIYYIFTVGAWRNVSPPNTEFKYSTFDMTQNMGLTGIDQLNVKLLSPVTEKLCATYHRNGRDVWIMVHEWKTNKFYAYLLTPQGLQSPIVSQVGTTLTSDSTCIGAMKFSPNGRKLAYVAYSQNYAELFKFDNSTGIVYDGIQVNLDGKSENYGLEFSPNSNVMYVTSKANLSPTYTLYQFNVQQMDAVSVNNSKKAIDDTQHHIAALQLAPNGKIYIAVVEDSLGVIAKPNLLGTACSYKLSALGLSPGKSQYGLPNTITKQADSRDLKVCEGYGIQLNPGYVLEDTLVYPFHYEWNGPDGFHSTLPKPLVTNATAEKEGIYTLTGYLMIDGSKVNFEYYNNLIVERKLNFKILGPTTLCTGDSYFLFPDTLAPDFKYMWSDSSRFSIKKIKTGGKYKLYITHGTGCLDSAELEIKEYAKPISRIKGPNYICNNESITLQSESTDPDYSYKWNTGATDSYIKVTEPGLYTLKITNPAGCFDSSFVMIKETEPVQVNIPSEIGICGGSAIMLTAEILNPVKGADYVYKWSTGATTPSALISGSGDYWVEVSIEGQCKTLAKFHATKADKPKIELNVSDTVNICGNDSVWVEVTNYNPSYEYHWNDGYTQPSRYIKGSGLFTIYADNMGLCSDSVGIQLQNSGGPKFGVLPGNNVIVCNGSEVVLKTDSISSEWEYLWSNNATTDSIIVDQSGTYFLTVTDKTGCSKTTIVKVSFVDLLPVSIKSNKYFCAGDSCKLLAFIDDDQPESFSYKWSTGDTTQTIYTKSSGKYTVEVTSKLGCIGTDEVTVTKLDYPSVKFAGNTYTICKGDSILIRPDNISPEFTYEWLDGSFPAERIFKSSGTYKIVASNKNFCSDTATISIETIDKPKASIVLFGDSSICKGKTVALSAEGSQNFTDLIWSTGDTIPVIEVSEPGIYTLYAYNSNGCMDSNSIAIKQSEGAPIQIQASSSFICKGGSANLSVQGDFESIEWSTGAHDKSIAISEAGEYSVEVVYQGGCTAHDTIEIYPADVLMDALPQSLEFSANCSSGNVQREFTIKNQSGFITRISGTSFDVGKRFSLLEPLAGLELTPDQEMNIKVVYNFLQEPEDYDTLYIFYDKPCAGITAIPLSAKTNNTASLYIEQLEVDAGIDTCISIFASVPCAGEIEIGNSVMEIKLMHNSFVPQSVTPGTIISQSMEGDYRIIKIKIPPTTISSTKIEIARLCGLVTLGDSPTTEISMQSFTSESGITDFDATSGSLTATGCMIGFKSVDFLTLTQMEINPNPVQSIINVNISSEESGNFDLKLINSNGEIIYSNNFNCKGETLQSFNKPIDATSLSDGIYFVKLQSPWEVITRKVIIMKK